MQRGKAYDIKTKAAHDYDHESRRVCRTGVGIDTALPLRVATSLGQIGL